MRRFAFPAPHLEIEQFAAQGMRTCVPLIRGVFWQYQPPTGGASAPTPQGTLPIVSGTFTDDAERSVQRQITLNLAYAPAGLEVGNWIQVVLGLKGVASSLFALPVMTVIEIRKSNTQQGGATITAGDPAEVMNTRPYEIDSSLSQAGTLRDLVQHNCNETFDRVADTSQVPAIPIPAEMVAEFGEGFWDACLKTADALGVALRFTDDGDVVGRMVQAPAPVPVTVIERVLVPPGGTSITRRYPTNSVALVTRGPGQPSLIGKADLSNLADSTPAPPWYLPVVVVERYEGDETTTLAQADTLAEDLIRAKLGDIELYEDLSILPAPWLEAGVDTVSLGGHPLWVRALTLDLPSLATAVTLRRVIERA